LEAGGVALLLPELAACSFTEAAVWLSRDSVIDAGARRRRAETRLGPYEQQVFCMGYSVRLGGELVAVAFGYVERYTSTMTTDHYESGTRA
jgi:hypothetical protein